MTEDEKDTDQSSKDAEKTKSTGSTTGISEELPAATVDTDKENAQNEQNILAETAGYTENNEQKGRQKLKVNDVIQYKSRNNNDKGHSDWKSG